MRPALCITTSFDDAFAPIGEYAALTIVRYAEQHGLSSHVERGFEIDRAPAWRRIKLIAELFDQGFEFVLWIDADAIFNRFDASILPEITPEAHLYLARVSAPLLSEQPYPNTGVMLLRNCDWSRRLLLDLWGMEEFAHGFLWENGALVKLMGLFSLYGDTPDQPNRALLDHVKWLPDEWNHIPNGRIDPDAIVAHWAGIPWDRRVREIPTAAMAALHRIS